MKKPMKKEDDVSTVDVFIIISGGNVQTVRKTENTVVEIHDYDVEYSQAHLGPENRKNWFKDEEGYWYHKMFWDKGNFGTE